jgi:hypothetical protein
MIAALLVAASVLAPPAPPLDPGLERGIKHVDAGEWDQGIAALSDVVRRLAADKTRQKEVAQACLYSGVAYAGLGQKSPALSQFSQALLRDPQIRLDPARASKAAVEIFEEARRETSAVVASRQPKKKGGKVALIGIGVLAAGGAGVAIAGGGGSDGSTPPTTLIPATFTVTGSTGEPELLLLTANPPSASRVSVSMSGTILNLAFTFLNNPRLPNRVQIRIEMLGSSGNCLNGASEVAEVNRAQSASVLTITSLHFTCALPFVTTSMNVRLFDADANVPVSLTSYSGGYRFEP